MATTASSDSCRFCGNSFSGVGKDRSAAEADAECTLRNHEHVCANNPANQE